LGIPLVNYRIYQNEFQRAINLAPLVAGVFYGSVRLCNVRK
jgi:hypothetical protein